ncbi:MAG: TetR/AcrR family transcriptional regulator [Lachnospiraceae bacterium]
MKQENDTKAKLLKAAKEVFMEKGYQNASLRHICRQAGVTTGALYFFFQDKEDVFTAIVKEPIEGLYHIMLAHIQEEKSLGEEIMSSGETEEALHLALSMHLVEYLYQYRDEFLLLLTKAAGSRYENAYEDLVDVLESAYSEIAAEMAAKYGHPTIDKASLHTLFHLMAEIFILPLTHGMPIEEAKKQVVTVGGLIMQGWYAFWEAEDIH